MYEYKANVVRVIDGDTVVLDIDLGCKLWLKDEHCRLYGINTPEVRGGTAETKEQGLLAKAALITILDEASNEIVIKTELDKTGKFGRLLVSITTADYDDVNGWLVSNGYAEESTY